MFMQFRISIDRRFVSSIKYFNDVLDIFLHTFYAAHSVYFSTFELTTNA